MNRRSLLRRTTLALSSLATLGAFVPGAAFAEGGTRSEAEAMGKRAAALIKSDGDKAYAEFTNGTSFKDRDLYVSAYDMKGNCLAHGGNPKLVGKNLMALKDPKGFETIKEATAVASKGKGWLEGFEFVNPTTKQMQEKAAYIERVNDSFVLVGIYK